MESFKVQINGQLVALEDIMDSISKCYANEGQIVTGFIAIGDENTGEAQMVTLAFGNADFILDAYQKALHELLCEAAEAKLQTDTEAVQV